MSLTAGSGMSGEAWRRRYVGWGAVGVLAPLSWVNPLLGEPGFENSRVRLSRAGSIGRRCAKEKAFFRASGVPCGGVEHPRGGESELLRSATG